MTQTWGEMTWDDMRWHEMTWDDMRWHEMTWDDMRWHEMTWDDMRWVRYLRPPGGPGGCPPPPIMGRITMTPGGRGGIAIGGGGRRGRGGVSSCLGVCGGWRGRTSFWRGCEDWDGGRGGIGMLRRGRAGPIRSRLSSSLKHGRRAWCTTWAWHRLLVSVHCTSDTQNYSNQQLGGNLPPPPPISN